MDQGDHYIRHRVYVDVLAGDLWVAEDENGELYLPLRPTCSTLEIDSTTALETIKADSRLALGLRVIRLPTSGGEQRLQCLRSTEYSWWLALIDPRKFKEERRMNLIERQRVLMNLARDIMLKRQELRTITAGKNLTHTAIQGRGQLEGDFQCLKCGAPHHLTIDGAGWHLHLGIEVGQN
jgi:P22_AR N-terminal domain